MPTTRISEKGRAALQELSAKTGRPQQEVLDEAIEAFVRASFLEQLNQAFAELRADPIAWQEELAERAAWEVTASDGADER